MIVVQPVAEKEECLVPPVVESGYDDRAADRRIEIVIFERRVSGELVEDLPVQPGFVDVALLRGKMKFVCAALRRQVVGPARRMSNFSGDASSEYLRFLQRIHWRRDQRVGVAKRLAQRLLGGDAVDGIRHLLLGLAQHVISAAVVRLRAHLVVHKVLRLRLRDRRFVNVFRVRDSSDD